MHKPTILIVDDEDYTLDLLKKVLEKRELNLFFAMNGEEALDLFKKEPVDIILLDQKMPGISGLDVLKFVKSLDPNVVVVIMTGYGTIGEAVEAMKFGAFHYMTKPFNDLDEIDVVVNKALRERALLDEVSYLRKKVNEAFSYKGMIGKSEVYEKDTRPGRKDRTYRFKRSPPGREWNRERAFGQNHPPDEFKS